MKHVDLERFRIRAVDELTSILEKTEDIVWLGRKTRCRRYTLRGVPGRLVDVLVADDVWSPRDPRDALIVEIGTKRGKYDGSWRDRFTLRRMPGHQCRAYREIAISVTLAAGEIVIAEGARQWRYNQLRHCLDGYNVASIFRWHWRRYYTHLTDADVDGHADQWSESIPQGMTLAEANRSASRYLYRISRDCGWRKLTLREREKYGVDRQWVRGDELLARLDAPADGYSPTGESEHSRRVATGWGPHDASE